MESYKGNISASGTVFGTMMAQKGPKGEQGKQGEKGDTPQKGIDYYTEQDKQELIEELTADIQNVKDDFNSNVTSKTTEFNNNASSKITEYNSNAAEKINEYNQNADGLISKVTELEKENILLKSQIPSATVVGETIHLEDSSNMQCQIMPLGVSIQEGTPSIENEAPIESVGDNINLIDARYGVDIRGNDAYRINVMPNTDYTLSLKQVCIALGSDTRSQHWYKYYDETDTLINQGQMLPFNFTSEGEVLSGTKTFKTPQNCTYIVLDLGSYNSTPNTLQHLEVKLVKGTSTGAYSPYGQGSIEIYNCNENFLQNEGVSKTINGVAFRVNKDGTVIANGTATDNVSLYVFAEGSPVRRKPLNIKNGDCILSGCPAGGGSSTYRLGMIYSEGSNNYFYIVDNGSGISFNYDGKNVGVYCEVRKGYTANNLIFKPMIRLATDTDNIFVPHQYQTKTLYTQQPFRAIGDVKDRFVKVDGVWDERHPVYRKIFDGTENITKSTTTEVDRFFIKISSDITLKEGNGFSNHFRYEQYSHAINTFYCDNNNGSRIIINFSEYGTKTLEEFKAKLTELYNAGTPLYIDYVLEEPLLIPCTPEQVEVLESFNTYKNVTNISSDSIGELEVTYSKDLETLYNNLSQAVLGGN